MHVSWRISSRNFLRYTSPNRTYLSRSSFDVSSTWELQSKVHVSNATLKSSYSFIRSFPPKTRVVCENKLIFCFGTRKDALLVKIKVNERNVLNPKSFLSREAQKDSRLLVHCDAL